MTTKFKIIAFGDHKYKRVAHNWALHLHLHGIKNYTIYALDEEIYDYLTENSINAELLPTNMFENKNRHWKERLNFIANLLKKGEDVLHSDLDAVWLKNPLGFIEKDCDIIGSTGSMPRDQFAKLGYAICMGWIYYKSSIGVKKLLKKVLNGKEGNDSFDDQIEFNKEVYKELADYPEKRLSAIERDNFFQTKLQNLKIKILDEDIISRKRVSQRSKNTYVVHPLSPTWTDREELLKSEKLWILK